MKIIKRTVHQKIYILSLITHVYVILNFIFYVENSRLYCGSIYLGIYLLISFQKYCVFSLAHYILFFAYYIVYILYSMHRMEVGILKCKESILNELFSTNQLIQLINCFLWKKTINKISINYFLVHRKNNSIQVRNDMKGSK